MALVAMILAASGGFRATIAGVRIALTSPYRVLAWAIGVTAVRHAITREQPMYRRLLEYAAAWRQSVPLRNALLVTVATRPVVLFAGYLAVLTFGFAPGSRPFNYFSNELLNLPLRFDAG